MSGMTGGIGRATTVLCDYFRVNYGWKVYSIYAFEAKEDCVRTFNDGAIKRRLHDRLGLRQLAQNYERAVEFIRENKIKIVIIQTSMDVVAKLRKALNRGNLQNVKVISVLHYSPGTDEFPISVSNLKQDILKGKASVKTEAFAVAVSNLCIVVYYTINYSCRTTAKTTDEIKKKNRRRPTLARASPALPLAMRRLTSVFGMGTGMAASLWSPAKLAGY